VENKETLLRLLLALVLSTAVIFFFNKTAIEKKKQAELAQKETVEQVRRDTTTTETRPSSPADIESATTPEQPEKTIHVSSDVHDATLTLAPEDIISGPEKTVRVRSDLYDIEFQTRGALVTSWKLIQYPETPQEDPRLLDLKLGKMERVFPQELTIEEAQERFSDEMFNYYLAYLNMKAKAEESHLFEEGQDIEERPVPPEYAVELVPQEDLTGTLFLKKNGRPFDKRMVYSCEDSDLIINTTQSLVFVASGRDLEIRKTFTFYPDSYECGFSTEVTYKTGDDEVDRGSLELQLPSLLGRYLQVPKKGRMTAGNNAIVQARGKIYKISNLKGGPKFEQRDFAGAIEWAGMDNRYFISALVPDIPLENASVLNGRIRETLDVVARIPIGYTTSGETVKRDFVLYMGPKDTELLAQLGVGAEKAVFSVGLLKGLRLAWICPLILGVLKALYKVIPNYGVGILILTVLAKWITYPLTIKSLRSMKKMQDLRPQVELIKEKYKDNPQEVHRKTMEFYKEQGVNPMGGCWPMLLQMPVFIGLFMTLNYSIQLRGEPFMLWIQDLSRPDTIFFLPVLGFIPFNVLPLLSGILMYIQQKKQMADPQQAAMAKIMPIFFTFICWNMPSGVVLYWTVNSLLQAVQQKLLDQPKQDNRK